MTTLEGHFNRNFDLQGVSKTDLLIAFVSKDATLTKSCFAHLSDDALEYKPSGRIYLRRLSGSEDALLGRDDERGIL